MFQIINIILVSGYIIPLFNKRNYVPLELSLYNLQRKLHVFHIFYCHVRNIFKISTDDNEAS